MTSPHKVRIGTRGSPLALYQAAFVARSLETYSDGAIASDLITYQTKGDQLTTERLINSGGKGLFTREIDRAVDDGEIDLAVHSLKDVPSELPDGQSILACPKRADARDGLVTVTGARSLADLPHGATLGTASLRREAQALAMRPDLKVVPFRGNVQTRLKKLEAGEADATFLAMAGLERLDLAHLAAPISITDMLPAASQGIIAIVGRRSALAASLIETLERLDDDTTHAMATAERAFLRELDGSCRTAMAANLSLTDRGWSMRGEVLAPDGQKRWQAEATALLSASLSDLDALGRMLGKSIRRQAGGQLPVFEDA
ncbi:MAG: hydroxymethylbilane synthase [Pseudomonadota bacterium]